MPDFAYVAEDNHGRRSNGVLTAPDSAAARTALGQRGLRVVRVMAISGQKEPERSVSRGPGRYALAGAVVVLGFLWMIGSALSHRRPAVPVAASPSALPSPVVVDVSGRVSGVSEARLTVHFLDLGEACAVEAVFDPAGTFQGKVRVGGRPGPVELSARAPGYAVGRVRGEVVAGRVTFPALELRPLPAAYRPDTYRRALPSAKAPPVPTPLASPLPPARLP